MYIHTHTHMHNIKFTHIPAVPIKIALCTLNCEKKQYYYSDVFHCTNKKAGRLNAHVHTYSAAYWLTYAPSTHSHTHTHTHSLTHTHTHTHTDKNTRTHTN